MFAMIEFFNRLVHNYFVSQQFLEPKKSKIKDKKRKRKLK